MAENSNWRYKAVCTGCKSVQTWKRESKKTRAARDGILGHSGCESDGHFELVSDFKSNGIGYQEYRQMKFDEEFLDGSREYDELDEDVERKAESTAWEIASPLKQLTADGVERMAKRTQDTALELSYREAIERAEKPIDLPPHYTIEGAKEMADRFHEENNIDLEQHVREEIKRAEQNDSTTPA